MECKDNLKFLKLLAKQYPTVEAVSTEIINLSAIINLPKGTEHFLTDVHGEHEAFDHAMRTASGVVKRKIEDTFKDRLSREDKNILATLVYYPKEKLQALEEKSLITDDWYKDTVYRLILLCRAAGYKYTRSKVRKALPETFSYIIEELFHEKENSEMKYSYYQAIIDSIIDTGCAEEFIIDICQVIRRLIVDRLHIIGDIYDRGPGAHIIMDVLMNHYSVDIQWGNHDILWMGAAAGSEACIINALRIAIRYGNLETIEDGYGINLSPLIRFTLDTYNGYYNKSFRTKVAEDNFKEKDIDLLSRMQKALAVLQFKLEGKIIQRRPEFQMGDRRVFDGLNLNKGTVVLYGKEYKLNDTNLPTINPDTPYELTEEEQEVLIKLKHSFLNSEKLKLHIEFLYNKGKYFEPLSCSVMCMSVNTEVHPHILVFKFGIYRIFVLSSWFKRVSGLPDTTASVVALSTSLALLTGITALKDSAPAILSMQRKLLISSTDSLSSSTERHLLSLTMQVYIVMRK